jgi:hypothetical protein
MARDKLITIRIEGEKREAFNNLAKSQNTDTASLLYDFISQCLDGGIDISLVTGKGNRLDNRIDSNRIDKLEMTTQKIDERVGSIAKKLTDWVIAFDDRLNDCDQGLSNKIISLEHRLNALSIQQDSQQIDRIDTDSQKDRQGETPDMEPVATVETGNTDAIESLPGDTSPDEADQPAIETVTPEVSPSPPSPPGTDAIASIDGTVETVNTSPFPPSPPLPPDAIGTLPTVEAVEPISTIETVASAIGPVPCDSPQMKTQLCEGMTAKGAAKYLEAKRVVVSDDSLHRWIRQEKIPDSPQGKDVRKHLTLRDKLYYPIN